MTTSSPTHVQLAEVRRDIHHLSNAVTALTATVADLADTQKTVLASVDAVKESVMPAIDQIYQSPMFKMIIPGGK